MKKIANTLKILKRNNEKNSLIKKLMEYLDEDDIIDSDNGNLSKNS